MSDNSALVGAYNAAWAMISDAEWFTGKAKVRARKVAQAALDAVLESAAEQGVDIASILRGNA